MNNNYSSPFGWTGLHCTLVSSLFTVLFFITSISTTLGLEPAIVSEPCDNLTDGGEIEGDETGCGTFDPAPISSVELPSGGSGNIEYVWLASHQPIPPNGANAWMVEGADGPTYDPGPISQTTYFRRCARREFCTSYIGESNDIVKTVEDPSVCNAPEILQECDVFGYQTVNSRIFTIPEYGQFKAHSSGLTLTLYTDGTALLSGKIVKTNNYAHKFDVELHFIGAHDYDTWISMGYQAKGVNLGDETTWTFYELDTNFENVLSGSGNLNGQDLYVYNEDPNYGLQIGQGANDKDGDFGFSWWFNYPNSQGHGDINADSECECISSNIQFAGVPEDLEIECGNEIPSPAEVEATDGNGQELEVTFTESIEGEEGNSLCSGSYSIIRTWSATNVCGTSSASQTITVQGDVQAPSFNQNSIEINGCDPDLDSFGEFVVDNCDENPEVSAEIISVEITSGSEDEDCQYRTQTPGGWGAPVAGNNPGAYLHANFNTAFPNGITIGCDNSFTFTSAQSITNFLPSGGPPSPLPSGNTIDPVGYGNSFAGHVLSLAISVGLDNAIEDFGESEGSLGMLEIGDGPLQGMTVLEVLNAANSVIGGCSSPYSLTDLHETITAINENFVDGEINNGYLNCNSSVCGAEVTVHIVATDECGNTLDQNFTFFTEDTEAPSLIGIPEDMILTCGGEIEPAVVTAIDDCAGNLEVSMEESVTGQECDLVITYTYTATDNCGNTASGSYSVTVVDDEVPVIAGVPQDMTVSCGSQITPAEVTATDNCTENLDIILEESISDDGCNEIITYSYTVTDNCGNSASNSYSVSIVDNDPPILNGIPEDIVIDCGQPISPAEITATDNCDQNVDVEVLETISGEGCDMVITYTYTATDDCSNTATGAYSVSILDDVAPIFSEVPGNMTVSCGTQIEPAVVTATDNCAESVEVFVEESIIDEECNQVVTFTYTATDNCLNTATASYTVTIIDEEAPVLFGVPEDMTLSCDALVEPAAVTATDNCTDNVDVTVEENINNSGCNQIFTYTYTASDNCSNSVSQSYSITLVDNEPPILSGVPQNESVSCGDIPAPPQISAQDNCDPSPSIEFSEEIIANGSEELGSDACGYTIIRTWTSSDACGNTISEQQEIEVNDDIAPEIAGVPDDVTVNCGEIPLVEEVTALDNCYEGEIEVIFDETVVQLNCGYQLIRTWTAEDDCANSVTETQLITVIDNTAPSLSGIPEDHVYSCQEDVPEPVVTANDGCTEEVIITFSSTTEDLACGYQIINTWTATDDCGNEVSDTQVVTVMDDASPILIGVPADIEVSCSNLPTLPMVSAEDNCDQMVEVEFSEEIGEGCPYTITRTWSAQDDCGNSVSQSQVITVVDNEPPVLNNIPEDSVLHCDEEIPSAGAIAIDNCTQNIVVNLTETEEELECGYRITRVWSAEDNCGNQVSASQVITVIDSIAPTASSVPEDITVDCSSGFPEGQPEFDDNCDAEMEIVYSEQISELDCGYQTIQSWTAVDDCGNETTVSRTVTSVDNTAPQLQNVPQNATVNCGELPEVADILAVDDCDNDVSISFSEEMEELPCGFILTRTWTATDDCGNQGSASQVITVIDDESPLIGFAPEDYVIDCNGELTGEAPEFNDNCDAELEVELITSENPLDCGYELVKTWSATDDCGNSVSYTQVITIQDTSAPLVISAPEDLTITCSETIPQAEPAFADLCDQELEITLSENTINLECGYQIERVWLATDDCGFQTQVSQVITVIDNAPPTILDIPEDQVVSCVSIPEPAQVSVSDNCDDDVELIYEQTTQVTECGYNLIRTWTATDDCGNSSSEAQIIFVEDNSEPVLFGVPGNMTAECDNIPEPAEVSVSDDCDESPTLTLTETEELQDCGYLLVRTWTAQDNCGNSASATQVITVSDNVAPTILSYPEDLTVECSDIPAFGEISAEDNCDDNLLIETFEDQTSSSCGFTLVRTWIVTDDCGNSSSASQTIFVTDTTGPEISGVPADTTVECGQIPSQISPVYTDACDTTLITWNTEEVTPIECGYILTRMYRAVDDCGNQTIVAWNITVTDETLPVFNEEPEDLTIDCNDESPVPIPSVSATDNCDDTVEISFEEVVDEGCPYQITRIWTATDDCGNTSVIDQVITVEDNVPPVFIDVEPLINLECDEVDDHIVEAVDNCSGVSIEIQSDLVFSGGCLGTIERTWIATDECGNSTTYLQLIHIVDTTAPEILNVPGDVVIECGEDIPPAPDNVIVEDNCNEVALSFNEEISDDQCPYQITRTWVATDNCGNVSEAIQLIEVVEVAMQEQVNILAYPNPFNNYFTLKFSIPQDANVKAGIYDMTGKYLMEIFNGRADAFAVYEFNKTSTWDSGTYIFKMIVDGEVYHYKLIVNNQ